MGNGNVISESYSTCEVVGLGYYVGGLVGSNYNGLVERSFATGSVTGRSSVGGLVGDNMDSGSKIVDCYATGATTGEDIIGGLVGLNYYANAEIVRCYSTGEVAGSSKTGGLVGSNNQASVINSYWDTATSNQASSAGGTGYVTSAMIMDTNSVNIYETWDFDNVWQIQEGLSYPYFKWQNDKNIPRPPSP